jgi:lipopolysaccharide biosynthesis regulator YciM
MNSSQTADERRQNSGASQANVVPMLRRIGEVVKTIFGLVESMEHLKAKNDGLTSKVDELSREVYQQAGQIRVLLEFVKGALDDRVEKRAEAAARAVLAEFEASQSAKSAAKKK